jgi:hypothetical protein
MQTNCKGKGRLRGWERRKQKPVDERKDSVSRSSKTI